MSGYCDTILSYNGFVIALALAVVIIVLLTEVFVSQTARQGYHLSEPVIIA